MVSHEDGKWKSNDQPVDFDCIPLGDNQFHILVNGKSLKAELVAYDRNASFFDFIIKGKRISLRLEDRYDELIARMGMESGAGHKVTELAAPMPGLVLQVLVKKGDEVKAEDPVIILEAMKMENSLNAPADLIIDEVKVKKGDKVDKNQVLITFE